MQDQYHVSQFFEINHRCLTNICKNTNVTKIENICLKYFSLRSIQHETGIKYRYSKQQMPLTKYNNIRFWKTPWKRHHCAETCRSYVIDFNCILLSVFYFISFHWVHLLVNISTVKNACYVQHKIRSETEYITMWRRWFWVSAQNQISTNVFYRCTVYFEICLVHSPTNALFINLVKSFKFTLKYTTISLLHVSVFNDHH